ncbi:MAG: glycerophosphodiester phosphodiesterase family protein [Pyrinomonadaceae bacterium]
MKITRSYPLIIAHRGSSAAAPENTFAAFGKALDDGAEGIEFDVRLAGDGVPVVFHDSDLKRICGIDRKVSDLSSKELKKLDAGTWFNEKNRKIASAEYSKEGIPNLEETLEFLSGYKGVIYVELKARENNVEALSKTVSRIVKDSHLQDRIIIKSFKLQAIPFLRKHAPGTATAALFAPKVMNILRKEKRLINIAHDLGVDRISVHFSLATGKLMKKAVSSGLPVTIWTADNPRWVNRAIQLGIDHVITNSPGKLLRHRDTVLAGTA